MSAEKKTTTAVSKTENSQVAKVKVSPSERFTNAVMREVPTGGEGKVVLSNFQKKLIQNYFIKLDGVLKESEVKRLAKSGKWQDPLEYSWANVNMNKLAQDVVAYSSVGLDPLQKNHINPIPYKNKKTSQFDITFIEGFVGLELKAKKYGYDVPDEVKFELKYAKDAFKIIKKDANNEFEDYTFDIVDAFDRGELQGGFYKKIFFDQSEKNSVVLMTRKDIEKRKPAYASAEFWGGEKDNWVNGQKEGKIQVEGWEEEMFLKTLKRHCWDKIGIDSEKIDENYHKMLQNDLDNTSSKVSREIDENANGETIDIDGEEVDDAEEVKSLPDKKEEAKPEPAKEKEPAKKEVPTGKMFS